MRISILFITVVGLALPASYCAAGPFVDPGLTPRAMRIWADGYVDESYAPASGVGAPHDIPASALGPADGLTVSLGDLDQDAISAGAAAGQITVSFTRPVFDGPEWDLAVFENGFRYFPPDEQFLFAELAYVEISSNGRDFARLPATSLTTERFEPFGSGFAGIDPTDVDNLAGKHGNLGTGLDLADLADHPLALSGALDLRGVRFVRLIDIPGGASLEQPLVNVLGFPAFTDATGHVVLDAWNTAIDSFRTPPVAINAGFDLDAVGARYVVPEPAPGLGAAWIVLGSLLSRSRERRAALA